MTELDRSKVTIGLFGTCDNIRWRDSFMQRYDVAGIQYFNPMVDDWHPGLVAEENHFLANSEVILFPVLKDSLGSGSLGEIGFSVKNVLRRIANGENQCLIALIDDDCAPVAEASEAQITRSIKDRKLVKSKLMDSVAYPNIIMVKTLEEMFTVSMDMYQLMVRSKVHETEVRPAVND